MTSESAKKEDTHRKTQRKRSPNFPALDLRTAIDRTAQLFEKAGTHEVSFDSLASYWRYRPKSSGFIKAIAAVTSFELVNVTGTGVNRRFCVSDSGEHIVEAGPESKELLKKAALKPKIFAEMWERYREKGLPSNEVLSDKIRWDKDLDFNKDSVLTFISRFRDTIEFAKIEESARKEVVKDKGEEYEDDIQEQIVEMMTPEERRAYQFRQPNVKTWTFHLIEGEAVLRLPQPMSEKSFEMLVKLLGIAKTSLVSGEPTEESAESTD